MSNSFAACGCGEFSKTDLERFTDRVEDVLNEERGRNLFRKFMDKNEMKDGLRVLDFWEHVERLLHTHRHTDREMNTLLAEANEISQLDIETMKRLYTLAQSSNSSNEAIAEVIKILKVKSAAALEAEYTAFKNRLLKQSVS